MSEGWDVWAESNNFGIRWRKNTNIRIDEEDLNIDDNLMNVKQQDFLILGMLGHVHDRCQERPGGGGI